MISLMDFNRVVGARPGNVFSNLKLSSFSEPVSSVTSDYVLG